MKILLLTGHFPPEKTGGVGRPYSLYKYLPGEGIEVCVITKNLYGNMPNEKNICRYESFGNWRSSSLLSRKVFFKMVSLVKNKLYGINYDNWWVDSVLKNISDYAKDIDLIYATFPGPEVLEAAIKLKTILKVPLITEFRDGLAFETVIPNPNFFQQSVINQLEKRTVIKSDAIVTVGKKLSSYFNEKYNRKVFTVYNGFDESEFGVVVHESKKNDKKQLIHFGSLNASRNAKRDGLFKVLMHLKNKKIINGDNFELTFIGNISRREKRESAKYNLDKIINYLPHMNREEGFAFIEKNADYLLFYGIPDKKTIISSKLPEYIRLHKPVIGICKGNEAEEIIKKTGIGEVCDFDESSIEVLLLKAINNQIYFNPDYTEIEKFNRKKQASEIASIRKGGVDAGNK